MGSDWAVTTANPLEQIEVAVNRVDLAMRTNAPFLPEQRLTLADALAGFTSRTAYVNHNEGEAGSIAVGKRADLAILDRSIFTEPVTHIGDAKVEYTLASGRVGYERD